MVIWMAVLPLFWLRIGEKHLVLYCYEQIKNAKSTFCCGQEDLWALTCKPLFSIYFFMLSSLMLGAVWFFLVVNPLLYCCGLVRITAAITKKDPEHSDTNWQNKNWGCSLWSARGVPGVSMCTLHCLPRMGEFGLLVKYLLLMRSAVFCGQ